ncbi:Negative regulator of mitotic exit [Tulasnella sp. 408]|nr:Negative regulator of mitotic exit [Tulasnella sp. 408]
MSLARLETSGAAPQERCGHQAAVVGRVLVVFGGTTVDSNLYFLDLGHTLTAIGNTLWVYGGRDGKKILSDLWCIELGSLKAMERVRWKQIRKRDVWPPARAYHSAVHYDESIYIFGGHDDGLIPSFNDLWEFNTRTQTWSQVQCEGLLPDERDAHCATVIGDNMFIFSGFRKPDEWDRERDLSGTFINDAFVFNFADNTWTSLGMLGPTPLPGRHRTMVAAGTRLMVLGGKGPNLLTSKPHIHMAETNPSDSVTDGLARLQFTTETTNLKFTTEAVDLSRFVRKQGDAAHSLAGFSDVWKGELTETGQAIAIKVLRVANTNNLDNPQSGLLRKVAEGLAYLHNREPVVVHSDIKPANVLVNDEDDVKLCDFGVSKLLQDAPSGFTTTASIKGTLRYSAKELLQEDAESTTMSDVMTGKLPYANFNSDMGVIKAIWEGVTPAPEDYPELPASEPLWGVMRECWDEDPSKRPVMQDLVKTMSENRWKLLLKLLKFKRKSSSSTPEQQTSDISAGLGLSKEFEPLDGTAVAKVRSPQLQSIPNSNIEGNTTGSLTIHSRTDPNLSLRRGLGGKASAPQQEDDTSRNVGGVESRNALPERRHTNASVQEGPSASPLVPYALTWTEHKLELRPVRSLKRSDDAGMTHDVFPRFGHSCTAIPNSSGEFIVFGGKIPSGKEEISTNDVILMSTSDMSLTSLETNGAKPKPKAGHRAVIAGRVLNASNTLGGDKYLREDPGQRLDHTTLPYIIKGVSTCE